LFMYVYIVGKGRGGGAREQTLGRAATAGKPDGGAGIERASTAAERSSVASTSPMLSLACHETPDPRHVAITWAFYGHALLLCLRTCCTSSVLGHAAHHLVKHPPPTVVLVVRGRRGGGREGERERERLRSDQILLEVVQFIHKIIFIKCSPIHRGSQGIRHFLCHTHHIHTHQIT